jgi:DNA (cytosine-5)-methyltransferase 1
MQAGTKLVLMTMKRILDQNEVVQAEESITPTAVTKKITAVDLFSGAGGFSLGAKNAGVEIAGALELNRTAAETYTKNIKRNDGSEIPLICRSIMEVSPHEAMSEWGISERSCDIVIGGPPCQGFSTHRIADKGVDDPRNELLCRYFDYVKEIRPRVFIVENVPGLLWPRHASYLKRFYEMGRAADYDVMEPVVINARNYGVPQNRKRVFLLGIDKNRPLDIVWPPTPTHVNPESSKEDGRIEKTWVPSSVVFTPAAENDPNNIHMQHGEQLKAQFKNTPKNGGSRSQSGRMLKCHVDHSGHRDVYGRIDPSKPAPTMTTACINPSKGRFVHPIDDHGITLRQAARIQTFPDDFVFSGGLMAGGAQIGNAVPVLLAQALIESIVKSIKEDCPELKRTR